ncbi:MAG: Lon family ATP-dependent protease [Bacillota bacterium]|nr:Lon family ATP-dependent protease [Bacillota bacterium]
MNGIIGRIFKGFGAQPTVSGGADDEIQRQVAALMGILAHIYGADKLVLKAGKLDALELMKSESVRDRVIALERLVFDDPTIEDIPPDKDISGVIGEVEDEVADILARREVEGRLEKRIAERMRKKHEEYVREVRMQILKEDGPVDNAHTLKKYAELEKLETRKLARSALELLRPRRLSEVVGQERAIQALLSRIASPFPQHVILYGPPGVGKTTVARLVLEEAKKLKFTPFAKNAKFVEVDGATLRWDPREVTNPLLGSVHDPIYQGARRDLAETGVPEPKLGLVTEAHGGVLFIDEIGEMDAILLNKLLKVLEDKRVHFDSSYYDPSDPHVPKYIRKLFEEGAPADFVLIGATTRDPSAINPAVRSRAGEVYFEPLTCAHIKQIVEDAARRMKVKLEPEVADIISDYTIEGRKATAVLADAMGLAIYRAGEKPRRLTVTKEQVLEVLRSARMSPYVLVKAQDRAEVGHVFGLGVSDFVGTVIEMEAIAFPARESGKGAIRFNDTAGSMAKDSVFNAASVFRKITGKDLADYDVHVNVVGGGLIDGPSAGSAILIAILSAVTGTPVRQDVAMTGEISIQGRVKGVGGVFEKIYGARQAGMKKVVVPAENAKDVPPELRGIEVVAAERIEDVFEHVFETGSSAGFGRFNWRGGDVQDAGERSDRVAGERPDRAALTEEGAPAVTLRRPAAPAV